MVKNNLEKDHEFSHNKLNLGLLISLREQRGFLYDQMVPLKKTVIVICDRCDGSGQAGVRPLALLYADQTDCWRCEGGGFLCSCCALSDLYCECGSN